MCSSNTPLSDPSPEAHATGSGSHDPGSVSMWIKVLRDKADQDAAAEIYRRYFTRLMERLKSRVNSRLQSVSDSEDASQYVLSEVLVGLKTGRFPKLNDRNSLWALMIHIGDLRLKEIWRRETAAKRDVRAKTALSTPSDDSATFTPGVEPTDRNPPPDLECEVEDILSHLLGHLTQREHRDILVWELQGHSTEEMAAELSEKLGRPVPKRTVRRKRALVRDELRNLYSKESSTAMEL